MNKSSYPTKLQENIIVDVVFEIRFNAKKGFSNLAPGAARDLFGANVKIDSYPISNLPSQIREADPDLKYQPIVRMEWPDVMLMVGDYSLGIGYGTNYPGWDTFKDHIQKLLSWLSSEEALKDKINEVKRYSFKYVDFIPEKLYSELEKPFLVNAILGKGDVNSDKLRLQLELTADFGACLFDFNSPVQAVIDDSDAGKGVLVIVDTLRNLIHPLELGEFSEDLELHREKMHLKNKELFFEALSQELLEKLGAKYE